MTKITVALPDELIWDLKQVGLLEQTTQKELIVSALTSFVKKYKSKKEIPDYPFTLNNNN